MVYFLTFPIYGLVSIEFSCGTPVLQSISPKNHREDLFRAAAKFLISCDMLFAEVGLDQMYMKQGITVTQQ